MIWRESAEIISTSNCSASRSAAAVLPESEAQVLSLYRDLVGDTSVLVPPEEPVRWPYIVVIYDEFTYPIARAGQDTQDVLLRDYDGVLSWPGSKFSDLEFTEPGSVVRGAGVCLLGLRAGALLSQTIASRRVVSCRE